MNIRFRESRHLFVITGASSGIGRAVASALARRHRTVMAIGRSHDALRSLHGQYPDCIQTVAADLATDAGLGAVVSALDSCEKIDGIVHAAGSAVALGAYQDLEGRELLHHMAVHVAAPMMLNNSLRTRLEGARVVYLDSYSASSLRVGWAAYSIVKSAAQMAARAAAAELKGSTVIRVFPGGVRTPLVEAVLASRSPNETGDAFRNMDAEGEISEAGAVGEYLADILLRANQDQIDTRESWDFNNPADRIFQASGD